MNHDDWHVHIPVNGKTVKVPARVAALALGVSHEELIAELRKNGGDMSKIPEDWKRQARRRASETAAKINDSSVMGALNHYAKEQEK